MSILLGFEVPSGKRVEIPEEGHAGWFGQTQLSGKTTTFEAIVYRGGFKAVAFITKHGEGSFLTGRKIQPYFSEPTNDPEQPLWRWVQSILEASQNRKLRFEESWIISACDTPTVATTLAEVYDNIKTLLAGDGDYVMKGRGKKAKKEWKWHRKPVTGMNAGVYTSLKAYFDIVMPQLARLPYTKKLVLWPGLNVMDLRDYSMEMQALVIRSVIEHVYLRERNIRVIIPEAQDFVPQGKNTPVKMACETLVRKGAALKNFMWLDSQDMAAVEKVMLRAVSILGCGVQGEMHEINRSIEHMLGDQITARDIATLPIGHFYVRLPGGDVKKVYVQPAWMDSEVHARAIAMGDVPASSAKAMLAAFKAERKVFELNVQEKDSEEAMWKQKYETLKAEFEQLREAHDAMAVLLSNVQSSVQSSVQGMDQARSNGSHLGQATEKPGAAIGPGTAPVSFTGGADSGFTVAQLEAIWTYVSAKAVADPIVLMRLAVPTPELKVAVKRSTIDVRGETLQGKLALLISERFFEKEKGFDEVRKECLRRGFLPNGVKTPNSNIARVIKELLEMGFLTQEEFGYRSVPSMLVHVNG